MTMNPSPPNWRGLCEELFAAFNTYAVDQAHHDLLWRARAALAQPEPEVVGLSDEELWEMYRGAGTFSPVEFARSVLAADRSRLGASAPAGEVGELVADLRECAASCTLASKRYWAEPMRRAADLLKRLASPACVVLDSNPEAIAALEAASPGRIELLPEDAQVIEPAQHTILAPAPVPVALSERPWEREGWCDSEGRCWIHCPGQSWDTWVLMVPQNAIDGAHCLPATALPKPSGEVDE